jgi:hypothetical protein
VATLVLTALIRAQNLAAAQADIDRAYTSLGHAVVHLESAGRYRDAEKVLVRRNALLKLHTEIGADRP